MEQIGRLSSAGCELARVAVPKTEDADALKKLVYLSPLPIIADIHFNASLAFRRSRPVSRRSGSTRATSAGPTRSPRWSPPRRQRGFPCGSARTPARCRSISSRSRSRTRPPRSSRRRSSRCELLESLDYRDFAISVKSSSVPTMIRAYRMLSEKVPYPLHLGVTEAGPPPNGDDQERDRDRRAPDGRDRRHDPGLAHRRSGEGDRGRLGHPQVRSACVSAARS